MTALEHTDPSLLPLPPGWRRTCPWMPVLLKRGRVFVGPTGELVRVGDDGSLDMVEFGGRPHAGIAGDPALAGRPRRYP